MRHVCCDIGECRGVLGSAEWCRKMQEEFGEVQGLKVSLRSWGKPEGVERKVQRLRGVVVDHWKNRAAFRISMGNLVMIKSLEG